MLCRLPFKRLRCCISPSACADDQEKRPSVFKGQDSMWKERPLMPFHDNLHDIVHLALAAHTTRYVATSSFMVSYISRFDHD